MGLIVFAILVVYVLLVRGIVRREYYGVRNERPTLRAFRRSLVCAVFFGVGFLGAEGFGMLAPSLIAISVCIFLGAKELLVSNLISFVVSWAILLAFFFVREHYIESQASRGVNAHYGRFSLRQEWANQSRRLLAGLAAVLLIGSAIGVVYVIWYEAQLPDLELSYAEREFLPRSLDHAAEVQRLTGDFFATEGRLPCPEDEFIDVEALLRDAHHDWRIDFPACGRFSISLLNDTRGRISTILFAAAPDAGEDLTDLSWSCVTATYERIEKLTGGQCVYDPYARPR